ncbi:MAG TPA: MAPEG family protein, partial [Pseudomonadales bacterium]
TLRAKRAHLNDVENIPGFLVLALIFTLVGCSSTEGWAYFGVYFVARALHTIFYLKSVQPWRTAAFVVGQLTQLGIIVQLLLSIL